MPQGVDRLVTTAARAWRTVLLFLPLAIYGVYERHLRNL